MYNTNRKRNMSPQQVGRLTYAAIYLAIAMVLPFVTGQIPEIGSMICPMHIPALLCGFMCGWPWGMAVGFIAPPLRSALFGMPPMFPDAVSMAFELAVYGGMSGLLHHLLPRKPAVTYAVLIISMIAGRLVWGAVQVVVAGLSASSFTWAIFLTRAVVNTIPAIILQVILIPILVMAMDKAGLSLN